MKKRPRRANTNFTQVEGLVRQVAELMPRSRIYITIHFPASATPPDYPRSFFQDNGPLGPFATYSKDITATANIKYFKNENEL